MKTKPSLDPKRRLCCFCAMKFFQAHRDFQYIVLSKAKNLIGVRFFALLRTTNPRLRLVALFAISLIISGCNDKNPAPQSSQKAQNGAFQTLDPWILTTKIPDAPRGNRGIFLGNGFLGAGFGANGGSDETTKCFAAGVYNNEHLAELPQWNKLDLPPGNRNYQQSLDLEKGILTTLFGAISVTSFVSLPVRNLAILHVEGAALPEKLPRFPVSGDWISSQKVVSSHEAIWKLQSSDGKTDLQMRICEVADSPRSWTRLVQIDTAHRVLDSALPTYRTLLAQHQNAWKNRWRADIQIDGDSQTQQLVHALMFNLLSCVRESSSTSIPPEALVGDHYRGHIFWDAEIWMFPALLVQYPKLAKTILDYRWKHLKAARQNATKQGFKGADFPWESAASGNEVAPPEFARERHITADVGWAFWQFWLWTGDKKWLQSRGQTVISDVADFWASRAKWNAKTGKYDILQVLGPDENGGIVDNNLFTNAMAKSCLENAISANRVLDIRPNPQWKIVAQKLSLPFDSRRKIFLKNDRDSAQGTKQADAELAIYPAHLPMSRDVMQRTFDFHRARPTRFGPAMTTSIHTIIAARLGRNEQAETFFRESYRPFVRGPFLLFSEKRSLDRSVFATGIGGVLQSVFSGFGDLRSEDFSAKTPRRKIVLPRSWKRLTISGIRFQGKNYTLKVTPNSRVLKQNPELQ